MHTFSPKQVLCTPRKMGLFVTCQDRQTQATADAMATTIEID